MAASKNRAKNLEKWQGEAASSPAARADMASALDALAWCKSGDQLSLPGLEPQRFFGVAPVGDQAAVDALPTKGVGKRGPELLPQAFRAYLKAKYGSAVEGLSAEANRPLAAIVGELVQAYVAVCAAVGRQSMPTSDQISHWVDVAANLRQIARRYAAPFQDSPAPTQPASAGQGARVAVGLFTGKPQEAEITSGGATLAGLLNIEINQEVSESALEPSDEEQSDE
jgi:hypothetical protein